MKLEEFVKQNVDNHEFAYDENAWKEFEAKMSNAGLPAKSNRGFKFGVGAAAIIVVAIASYFMFINENEEKISSNKNTEVENIGVKNNVAIIENTEIENTAEKADVKLNDKITSSNHNKIKSNTNEDVKVDCKSNTPKPVNKFDVAGEAQKHNCNTSVPSAEFIISVNEGCQPLYVQFSPCVKSDSVIYLWNFGDGTSSTDRNPVHTYQIAGEYQAMLTVKHFTSSTLISNLLDEKIIVKPAPNIKFEIEKDRNNIYRFENQSQDYSSIKWDFGEDVSFIDESFERKFEKAGQYPLQITAMHSNGCVSTKSENIKVDIEHDYEMPSIFTPDGDGLNDFFGPIGENLEDYELKMYIYNKFGGLIFESHDVNKQWDGKIQGTNQLADFGVYAWIIITKDKFDNVVKKKGSVTLLKK